MLADVALALDPVLFARRAGVEPDPWQADVLRSTARRLLLNAARQSGKSSTTALVALHTALYRAGALVLVLSPSERQSKEFFRKVVDVYGALGRPVPPESETTLWLELEGGSRVVALPGKEGKIRGFSGVDLLVVDEASRVDDSLYYAIRPMLAVSGGRLLTLSTPWGRRGWWHDAWANGGPSWQRVEVPATLCPRIPADFLEEERRSLPPLVFQSEYECIFTDTDTQAFASADIAAARRDDLPPLFGGPAPAAAPAPRPQEESYAVSVP